MTNPCPMPSAPCDSTIPAAEWDFYESYYKRALEKIGKDMGDCEGFFAYLGENEPALYAKISAAEDEIDTLWLSRGEKEAFKAACRSWYNLLMEAKKGFDAWKAKEREKVILAGRQEAMAMR